MVEIRVTSVGGEYMDSVVVVAWHKAVGDAVAAGDPLVTLETAKAATDLEAEAPGILSEIRVLAGAEAKLGAVLGVVAPAGSAPSPDAPTPEPASAAATPPLSAGERPKGRRIVASPLARRVARGAGIALDGIVPSGPSGRIKRRDVEAVVALRGGGSARPAAAVHLYRSGGAGIPIVFLHGFGADGRSWRPVTSALRGGRPTILVDLPAHGRSLVDGLYDLRSLAAQVEAALVAEGLTEVHIVGHSLGGAVALTLLSGGRFHVRSLCLVASLGLGPEVDAGFIAGFARAARADSLTPWLHRLVAEPAFVTPAFVGAVLAARADEGMREAQRALAEAMFPDGTQTADLRGALAGYLGPQRIVWGLQDSIIPWRHALELSGRAGLHLLPGVGHMPPVEAPLLLARIIDETVASAG